MLIDISQYNKIVDWDAVEQAVHGIIMRIGYRGYGKYGTLCMDKNFEKNLREVEKRKIPYGIYWVSQATSITEILSECTFLLSNVIMEPPLGIWLDSEWSGHPQNKGRGDLISKSKRTVLANDFFKFFENKGWKCGLYCSESWIKSHLIYGELNARFFWIAKYGTNNGQKQKAPGVLWDIWQYTSKGEVPGIEGYVDLNIEAASTVMLPDISGYEGVSIVEALKGKGYPSSFKSREIYAKLLGIREYTGNAEQNLNMIKMLGGIVKP